MFKPTIAAIILATAAAAGAHAAQPTVSPAKKQLVEKVLQLWHIENVALEMIQDPVAKTLGQARVVLQGRVTPEKQEAALRDVAAEAQKFLEENTPVVKTSAEKLVPTTVAPILAEKFTEDELRQLIAILESPVKKKFETTVPELRKALGEKLAADAGPVIDPKLQDLNKRIGLRLRSATLP
jgi:hypothetical protein